MAKPNRRSRLIALNDLHKTEVAICNTFVVSPLNDAYRDLKLGYPNTSAVALREYDAAIARRAKLLARAYRLRARLGEESP